MSAATTPTSSRLGGKRPQRSHQRTEEEKARSFLPPPSLSEEQLRANREAQQDELTALQAIYPNREHFSVLHAGSIWALSEQHSDSGSGSDHAWVPQGGDVVLTLAPPIELSEPTDFVVRTLLLGGHSRRANHRRGPTNRDGPGSSNDGGEERSGPSKQAAPSTSSGQALRAPPAPSEETPKCAYALVTRLTHLPPATLRVRLPPTYPSSRAPELVSVSASWLRPRSKEEALIRASLAQLWSEGEPVLMSWVMWFSDWEIATVVAGPIDLQEGAATLPFRLSTDEAQKVGCSPSTLCFTELSAPPPFQPLHTSSSSQRPNEDGYQAPPLALPLSLRLQNFSTSTSQSAFDQLSFFCGICLFQHRGRNCREIKNCKHVFCTECITEHLHLMVKEGNVRNIERCPDPSCVKRRADRDKQAASRAEEQRDAVAVSAPELAVLTTVSSPRPEGQDDRVGLIEQDELHSLLGEEKFQRYQRLLQKTIAETDPTAITCPNKACQLPVVLHPADRGTKREALRRCRACGYCACRFCRKIWHGIAPCGIDSVGAVVEEYVSLPEGSPERLVLEQRYGPSNLLKLVRQHQDNVEAERWISQNSTPCPSCRSPVTKTFGCNHMICSRCMCHLCLLCGKSLQASNPYQHFNNFGSPCYQRLFENAGDPAELERWDEWV